MSTARSPTTWHPSIRPLAAIDDQLAEPLRSRVDDRARGRSEVDGRDGHVVHGARLRFGETYLGVFGVREAADRIHRVGRRHERAAHRIGRRHETLPSSPAAPASGAPTTSPAAKTSGAEVRRQSSTCTKPRASVSTPAACRFIAAVSADQPDGGDRRARPRRSQPRRPARSSSAPRPRSSRRSRSFRTARAPSRRRRGRRPAIAAETSSSSVVQDPLVRLEQLHPRPEGAEHRGDLDAGRAPADDQHGGGDRRQSPGVAVGAGQFEARDGQPPTDAAGADDDPVAPSRRPLSVSTVWASTNRAAPACSCTVTPTASIWRRRAA